MFYVQADEIPCQPSYMRIGNQRIPSVSVLRGLANVHLRQLVLIVAHADGSNRYVVIN